MSAPETAIKSQPDSTPGVVNSDFARQTELKKDQIDQTPAINQPAVPAAAPSKRRDSFMSSVNQTNLHPHGVVYVLIPPSI